MTSSTFQRVSQTASEIAMLTATVDTLEWDQRTHLPKGASEFRANQIAYLRGMIHQRETDPSYGAQLKELAETCSPLTGHDDYVTTIRQLERTFDKKAKLPQTLVEELSRTCAQGQHAWVEARGKNDFQSFRPWLEKIFELKRQQAEAVGYPETPYDALLDDFEPDARTSEVTFVLRQLREMLVPIVQAIAATGRVSPVDVFRREYPLADQERFGREAAVAIGFDFQRGRLDVTHHPFCTSLGPHDCRITTRYDANYFASALFGILHEAGHGIYEQGLRPEEFGLPTGSYLSLGIHESQSRLWENQVGRSRAFWEYFFPSAKSIFATSLQDVSLDDIFFAINDVRPSLIRVEADEATYNLHIVIRFELEQELLSENLQVADLPEAWNARYQEYLGIQPPNDADGVLQDIHWSAGGIGYFPTYSLGNIYAAQFYHQAHKELGDLNAQLSKGHFSSLRNWLRDNIHVHGQCYSAAQLVKRVCHSALDCHPLIDHLKTKLYPLYGIP